jgi:hypothetical protein
MEISKHMAAGTKAPHESAEWHKGEIDKKEKALQEEIDAHLAAKKNARNAARREKAAAKKS